MHEDKLPEGWTAGEVASEGEIYSDPPGSADPSRCLIYGMRESDPCHRLYSIPADTPLSDVVSVFQVGAHAAESYGYDADEVTRSVAGVVSEIAAALPCRVVFADAAGLKLRFADQINEAELNQIEAIFSKHENGMKVGLERYLSEWDGESPLLAPVMQENLLHLWWD